MSKKNARTYRQLLLAGETLESITKDYFATSERGAAQWCDRRDKLIAELHTLELKGAGEPMSALRNKRLAGSYADVYCEGYCERDNSLAKHSNDCGGCIARAALASTAVAGVDELPTDHVKAILRVLRTIADFPITGTKNMDAINMQILAHSVLPDESPAPDSAHQEGE